MATLKKTKEIVFQDQLLLNADHEYCSMLLYIELPFVIKIFDLSIFEWPFYTGFTVFSKQSLMKISEFTVSSLISFGRNLFLKESSAAN